MARDLPALLGTYLREGQEALYLGEPTRKELRAAVSEADAQHYAASAQEWIPVRLQGRAWSPARLLRMTPCASREPLHPARVPISAARSPSGPASPTTKTGKSLN